MGATVACESVRATDLFAVLYVCHCCAAGVYLFESAAINKYLEDTYALKA